MAIYKVDPIQIAAIGSVIEVKAGMPIAIKVDSIYVDSSLRTSNGMRFFKVPIGAILTANPRIEADKAKLHRNIMSAFAKEMMNVNEQYVADCIEKCTAEYNTSSVDTSMYAGTYLITEYASVGRIEDGYYEASRLTEDGKYDPEGDTIWIKILDTDDNLYANLPVLKTLTRTFI